MANALVPSQQNFGRASRLEIHGRQQAFVGLQLIGTTYAKLILYTTAASTWLPSAHLTFWDLSFTRLLRQTS